MPFGRAGERWKRWAKRLKTDIVVLYVATRDPRTPLVLKLLGLCLVAYALSPIDLIPDFIPILGLVDDLLILPLGIWFVMRRIPSELIDEYRAQAAQIELTSNWYVVPVVVALWLAAAIGAYFLLRQVI